MNLGVVIRCWNLKKGSISGEMYSSGSTVRLKSKWVHRASKQTVIAGQSILAGRVERNGVVLTRTVSLWQKESIRKMNMMPMVLSIVGPGWPLPSAFALIEHNLSGGRDLMYNFNGRNTKIGTLMVLCSVRIGTFHGA